MGTKNPRKTFEEFAAEKLATLSKLFVELSEETVLALTLNWMANKGKSGAKCKVRIRTEETVYACVVRIYANRMTTTKPVVDDKWKGKTLYVWTPTDCYYNLTALSLKQSEKRAKRLNWPAAEEYDHSIEELLKVVY